MPILFRRILTIWNSSLKVSDCCIYTAFATYIKANLPGVSGAAAPRFSNRAWRHVRQARGNFHAGKSHLPGVKIPSLQICRPEFLGCLFISRLFVKQAKNSRQICQGVAVAGEGFPRPPRSGASSRTACASCRACRSPSCSSSCCGPGQTA